MLKKAMTPAIQVGDKNDKKLKIKQKSQIESEQSSPLKVMLDGLNIQNNKNQSTELEKKEQPHVSEAKNKLMD